VLSGLPYIQFACCLWAQLGGALGAWMLQKQGAQELKYGDGAFVGVIAGLIGAFVATLVSIPVELITLTPEAVARFQERLEGFPMSPAVREAMFQFMSPGFNLSRTLIGLLMGMLGYGLFAMIGGILTVALLNRNKFD
jgi:hypothetical protein